MQIQCAEIERLCDERDVYVDLPLATARILELGCGAGEKTRAIAKQYPNASILAMEVDRIQHEKNLKDKAFPNIQLGLGGAEHIPSEDETFDVVFMFKSLHHVPTALMDRALSEIRRVLVPGGLAYISEPVFAGDYNEILRLFHNEDTVRADAFAALERMVASEKMELVKEIFFKTWVRFPDFAKFEEKVIGATHTHHVLTPAVYEKVKSLFQAHMTTTGAEFQAPMRVDLLRKPR